MATALEHYERAEDILAHAVESAGEGTHPQVIAVALAEAQVHAALALAAAFVPDADPSRLWWLDDGRENPGPPDLYLTEDAAREAAIEHYDRDNPFNPTSTDTDAWLPADEDEGLELAVRGNGTGIFVRPVRPKDGV